MAALPPASDAAVGNTKENSSPNRSTWANLETPLDFSFLNLLCPKDMLIQEPRGRKERKPDEKFHAKCVKLNNNHIQDASSLLDCFKEIIFQPNAITWIDLSFNSLQKIDPVLCQFPVLQILYLHGNSIENIKEVEKLARISTLKKLALHGNGMETTKNYRLHVLSRCRQLINLDMSGVSNAEREASLALFKPPPAPSVKEKKTDEQQQ